MAHPKKEDAGVVNKSKKRVSQAKRIISLVSDEDVVLFHDETRTTYACVPVDGHFETWPCDGRDFRDWLAGLVWCRRGEAPGSEALNAALNVLRAKARHDGEKRTSYNRIAFHHGVIYYDLADQQWRAVKITPQGWGVVNNPPVRFRRYSHQAPQVTPSQTGFDLRDVLRFVNLKDDSQGLLLLAYIVTCLVPDIPHPVIVFHRPQGSAKATVLKVIRHLVDPSTIKVLSPPGDLKELVQQLAHHYAPYFDNLSDLPRWETDVFCRAVTGEGFSKRQLYTDDEDVIYCFRRCLGMSGVNVAAY